MLLSFLGGKNMQMWTAELIYIVFWNMGSTKTQIFNTIFFIFLGNFSKVMIFKLLVWFYFLQSYGHNL